MLDSIHKMLLAGVGMAAMTKDKIDKHVEELVEKGKLSEKEGRELAEDMLKKSKQAKDDLEKQVEKQVQQTLQAIQIASKEDVEKLAARIEKLEAAKTE
ncbi:MAG: phasin family protein [candidate division Zixibacteria bacterium]|nr:phasin family protein [candidate division Zixibacteria bacterium]